MTDDEDSNDPFEEPDVEGVIKMPSKRKRNPEIKSSRKKRKRLPKILKKGIKESLGNGPHPLRRH